ncbi:MAG: tRNA-binding protein [Nanoarchaeota archaeon]
MTITYSDFEKVDIRVGKIINAEDFPEAKKPAYQLTIDFGDEIGIKKSSAQITKNYNKKTLIGKQIIAVVNFPTKKIADFNSEVLILGLPKTDLMDIILVSPDKEVPLGGNLS